MADLYARAQSGEPLTIPAATWNALVEMLIDYRQNQLSSKPFLPKTPPQGTIKVKNTTGAARAQFEVLGLSDPIIGPSANATEFRQRVTFQGVTPTADHAGRFAVLREPLRSGAVGDAFVFGATHCRIDVLSESDWAAEIKPGDPTGLVSGSTGSAQILWKEPGVGSARWALIRFGSGAGGVEMRLGILAGDLNYRRRANVNIYRPEDGTSIIANYVSTGEILSAGDWMLNPGEVLEGNTHVVIARFPAVTGNSWIVIAAACAPDPNGLPVPSLFAEALSRVPSLFVPPPPPTAVSQPPIVY